MHPCRVSCFSECIICYGRRDVQSCDDSGCSTLDICCAQRPLSQQSSRTQFLSMLPWTKKGSSDRKHSAAGRNRHAENWVALNHQSHIQAAILRHFPPSEVGCSVHRTSITLIKTQLVLKASSVSQSKQPSLFVTCHRKQ